jgi:hypothetical protein
VGVVTLLLRLLLRTFRGLREAADVIVHGELLKIDRKAEALGSIATFRGEHIQVLARDPVRAAEFPLIGPTRFPQLGTTCGAFAGRCARSWEWSAMSRCAGYEWFVGVPEIRGHDGIGLDVPPDLRVIVSEDVLVKAGLRLIVLPWEAQVVGDSPIPPACSWMFAFCA